MLERLREVESPEVGVENRGVDSASISVNTSGLPIFPDELLLEIMSYYSRPPDPLPSDNSAPGFRETEADDHQAWRETLLALSQTCNNLRLFFLPYLWERIEVCMGMQVGEERLARPSANKNGQKRYNAELVRQLEAVTVRDPSLAANVKLVNIELTDYSIRDVMAQLARCMSLFSNLRVVKLYISRYSKVNVTRMAGKVFSEYSYPQICSVIIPKLVYPFLSSCTEVRSVCWIGRHVTDDFTDAITLPRLCPKLESLSLNVPEPNLEDIVSAFPNLRAVFLRCYPHRWSGPHHFAPLSRLRHLQKIEIIPATKIVDATKQLLVAIAVALLLDLQKEDGEMKEVTIQYNPAPINRSSNPPAESRRETTFLPVPDTR